MSKIFSEDKDWVLLIGYVGLIYSTLQFMPKINYFFASLLGRYFGLVSSTMLIIAIFLTFIVIHKHKPAVKSPALFYAARAFIFALYLTLLLFALPVVSEKMHLLEYGFLSYLALRAVKNFRSNYKRYILVVLIVIVVGSCDELIQKFTPGRYCELRDVILNIVSGILGLSILSL